MIPFTMNILSYKNGTYTVVYNPQHPACKSIKLNIQLDVGSLADKDAILTKLKSASPQDYWWEEIRASEQPDVNKLATSLVGSSHRVTEAVAIPTSPVDNFSFHPVEPAGPLSTLPTISPETVARSRNIQGTSSPEETSSMEEQNLIKLKIVIQQVLTEMAEGTV